MVDQQDPLAIGRQHQAGAGDVAGSELVARKGIGRMLQDHEDEIARFGIGHVGAAVDEVGDVGGAHGLENQKASRKGGFSE